MASRTLSWTMVSRGDGRALICRRFFRLVCLLAGSACVAYDVCVHPEFLKKLQEKATFLGFFVSIVVEGLEDKYQIKLDRSKSRYLKWAGWSVGEQGCM